MDEDPAKPFGHVRYWQVSNEPGLNKWTTGEQVRVRGRYVLALAYGTWQVSELVRAECPMCQVMLAGASGYIRVDTWTERLLDAGGERKRGYDALRLLIGMLGDAESVARLPAGDPNVYLYRVDRPAGTNATVHVLWKERGMAHLDLRGFIPAPAAPHDLIVTTLGGIRTGDTLADVAIATHPKFIEIVPCRQ